MPRKGSYRDFGYFEVMTSGEINVQQHGRALRLEIDLAAIGGNEQRAASFQLFHNTVAGNRNATFDGRENVKPVIIFNTFWHGEAPAIQDEFVTGD